jgi:hypothetical protein
MRNSPTWLTVANASIRLRWRCVKHITAPSSAVDTPTTRRTRRTGDSSKAPENTVQ